MAGGISVDKLDQETLDKLGIDLPPSLAEIGTNLIVLGKVFTAIKGLSDEEALQVLRQAQMYIISKQKTPDIEAIGLPGDGLGQDYAPPIDWTLQVTAKVFGLKPLELKLRKRDAQVAQARQAAMYVLGMTNKYTFTHIGQAIGGRSPSTVTYAFNRIGNLIMADVELREKVQEIQKLIAGK
ncbi:Chromosomal replication initiator protein DnaA [subsurface metagenome]